MNWGVDDVESVLALRSGVADGDLAVSWRTIRPATTGLELSDGSYRLVDAAFTLTHSGRVGLDPGETLRVRGVSTEKDGSVHRTAWVRVEVPDPLDAERDAGDPAWPRDGR